MTNINWNEKPEWAIGAGYSTSHNLWLWFDRSHYQMPFGDVRFPFNSSFSKDCMTDTQYPPETKPEWSGEGLPPVGVGSKWILDKKNYFLSDFGLLFVGKEVTVQAVFTLPKTESANALTMVAVSSVFSGGNEECACFRVDMLTSIKSDKEKWVDQALKLDCEPSDGMLSRKDFCGVVYDAMQSGELPTIKVTK